MLLLRIDDCPPTVGGSSTLLWVPMGETPSILVLHRPTKGHVFTIKKSRVKILTSFGLGGMNVSIATTTPRQLQIPSIEQLSSLKKQFYPSLLAGYNSVVSIVPCSRREMEWLYLSLERSPQT